MKQRYAAELIFFYDKKKDGKSKNGKNICERKIYVISAEEDQEAFESAIAKGKSEEFSFFAEPYDIEYKFLGVKELMSLEDEDEDVVWAEFQERLNPEKRKSELLPDKQLLEVFKPISKKGKIKLLDK